MYTACSYGHMDVLHWLHTHIYTHSGMGNMYSIITLHMTYFICSGVHT